MIKNSAPAVGLAEPDENQADSSTFAGVSGPATDAPAALAAALQIASRGRRPKEPVQYVNPNIGGIGHLLTSTLPFVQEPHSMARLAPVTTPGITDRYLSDKIHGFAMGAALIMASTPESDEWTSYFDHDFEFASPYYYGVTLEDSEIDVEMTAAKQAAYYRFTLPKRGTMRLLIKLRGQGGIDKVTPKTLPTPNPSLKGRESISGYQQVTGPILSETVNRGVIARQYFYAEFSHAVNMTVETAPDGFVYAIGSVSTELGEAVECRVGLSYISVDQARRNLERDIPHWSFDEATSDLRALWNRTLGKISVDGGSERQRTVFYSALYRSLLRMTNITEDGQYFSGFDGEVHDAKGRDYYVDDGIWDTYRSMHPLQLLIDAPRQLDMVTSYLRMFEQSGWLPSFPSVAGEQPVMLGRHTTAFIVDAYVKGLRDFDVDLAYAAMKKSALEATMLPWRRGPATDLDRVYFEKGIFPALAPGETETDPNVHPFERRQAVAVTMENSYDDWCVAQMAKALGKIDDYELFICRARNWAKLYDERLGLVAPRNASGDWVEGFDSKLGGGLGGRDYFAEMNAWTYTFHVQHDPRGLAGLMGGPDKLAAKLDALFVEQYGVDKFTFLGQFPDSTGLIGQYSQGNEPSFHVPYLYNFVGQPWKTQRRVRQIMDIWYTDGPLGLCGDDDGGAMSSWYVLSAIGIYPFCPGNPYYVIGSPIFAAARVEVGHEKWFTISARDVSAQNKYIQSATLNGKPLNRSWLTHDELAEGGALDLQMGPRPNKSWASDLDAAPPSMSDGEV